MPSGATKENCAAVYAWCERRVEPSAISASVSRCGEAVKLYVAVSVCPALQGRGIFVPTKV